MVRAAETEHKNGVVLNAASSTLIGLVVSLVLPVIFSALLMAFGSSTSIIPVLGMISSVLGALAAGFTFGRKTGHNGLIGGLIVGAIYFLFLIFIGFIISKKFSPLSDIIILLITSLCGGILGGIIGVNTRGRGKR